MDNAALGQNQEKTNRIGLNLKFGLWTISEGNNENKFFPR